MEETQVETMKTSTDKLVFFPPHRRRPLKSETCRNLIRIFSHCYDEAEFSLDREVNTENDGTELGQKTENQLSQHFKFVGNDSTEVKVLAAERETEVNLNLNAQMTINQIEQLMRLEENEDSSNQKDVIGSQNPRIDPQQMLISELEHIVNAKTKDVVNENNLKQSDINEVELFSNQEEHVEFELIGNRNSVNASQKLSCLDDVGIGGSARPRENDKDKGSLLNAEVMEQKRISVADSNNSSMPISEFGDAEKGKSHAQKGFAGSKLSFDKNTVTDTLDSCHNNEDHGSLKPDGHEMSVKDTEVEKQVRGADMVGSADHMIEDVDMEEGEISGDYSIDDISMDVLLHDAETLDDKRLSGDPLNGCMNNKREFPCDEPNERDPGSASFATYTVDKNETGAVGFGENNINESVYTPDVVVQKETLGVEKLDENDSMLEAWKIEKKGSGGNNIVLHGQILENDAATYNKISTEKEGSEGRPKKKRGPSTKEKKAKKKQKQRMKRLEKNRQLGVKRLKLPPISKPKTVTYCRHYLNGRCQEGDNCKFSHDIEPLTKSKPCCYFARHQCMKGDQCPFDHQLSKYPCSNFVSRGFCGRGDDCLFSHKIIPKENCINALEAMETETEPASSTGNLTYKKEQKNDGESQFSSSVSSYSKEMFSQKNHENTAQESVSKQSGLIGKGTSFLSVGNSSTGKLKQQMFSPNNENQREQRGLGVVQNSTEISNRSPTVFAPKGINFLAFGVQRDDLSGIKLASTSASRDNGAKLSPLDNSNTPNQTSSGPYSSPMLNGTQPAVTPKGMSFLSFGKVSTDDSCSKGNAKLLSCADNGTDSCVKGKQNALQFSSTTSSALPSPPISLIQSSNSSASRIHEGTPHSSQKGLRATLQFAAKYESQMKLNQSNCDSAVATKTDKEKRDKGITGPSKVDLAKASDILGLLSSIGSRSKQ